jgi:hypothetical protein
MGRLDHTDRETRQATLSVHDAIHVHNETTRDGQAHRTDSSLLHRNFCLWVRPLASGSEAPDTARHHR